MARSSDASPAPSACAVNATVPMRRKPNSQNRQSNSTDASATPPSRAASSSRPIAVVETMPISGVVRFATIAGPAMANTCAVVTFETGPGPCMPNPTRCRSRQIEMTSAAACRSASTSAGAAEQPRQQPDRDHDHGAEQKVSPQPVDRVEAEIPLPLEQQADAVEDVPRIEADRREHHADEDRQHDQPERDRDWRA